LQKRGGRLVVLLEGRDAAGKGAAIKRSELWRVDRPLWIA
jgi:polyphosphate kinase 2 (PPK2 family)